MATTPSDRTPGAPGVKAEEKKKPGRPKGKPLSAKELAQRQAAAVKTGEHSERLLAKALPPCKKDACPAEAPGESGFPCGVKTDIESHGGGLAACLRAMGEADAVERFRRAIDGDRTALNGLATLSLGAYSVIERQELHKLINEGLVYEKPIVGMTPGPFGPQTEIIDHVEVENPRVANLLKISQLLGHTADQQVITPKARGEKAGNEGMAKLGRAAWIASQRRANLEKGQDEDA